jgi:hypothetical protein
MNKNNVQSNMCNVGSNLNWPQNFVYLNPTSYDVYIEKKYEKHHLWCTDQSESLLEKVLVAFGFVSAILILCFAVFVVF